MPTWLSRLSQYGNLNSGNLCFYERELDSHAAAGLTGDKVVVPRTVSSLLIDNLDKGAELTGTVKTYVEVLKVLLDQNLIIHFVPDCQTGFKQ